MNNSNSVNTPLHVVNLVASQSNFAFTMNLLFWGSINYTCCRFTFAALHAGDDHLRLDIKQNPSCKTTNTILNSIFTIVQINDDHV